MKVVGAYPTYAEKVGHSGPIVGAHLSIDRGLKTGKLARIELSSDECLDLAQRLIAIARTIKTPSEASGLKK